MHHPSVGSFVSECRCFQHGISHLPNRAVVPYLVMTQFCKLCLWSGRQTYDGQVATKYYSLFRMCMEQTLTNPGQEAGVCCQFVNKGLAPASYIFKHSNDSYIRHKTSYSLFSIVLRAKVHFPSIFGIRNGQDVSIFWYWYIACHLIAFVPIKDSDKKPKINTGFARAPPSPLQHFVPGSNIILASYWTRAGEVHFSAVHAMFLLHTHQILHIMKLVCAVVWLWTTYVMFTSAPCTSWIHDTLLLTASSGAVQARNH
jgi:hypothetical protein